MSVTELAPVLTAVERSLGIRCDGARSELIAEAVRKAMVASGCEDLHLYTRRLESDAVERERLAEALRVPETYFLRDADQMQIIAERIIPTVAPDDDRHLRIWSAGCASGEEAYSLAIVLETAGLTGHAAVLATDRSAPALEAARAGRYRPWALRSLDDSQLARYFAATGESDEVSVVGRLRGAITFEQHDLTTDAYPAGFDLIVCRNVLLYLTPERGREVVERFATALAPGGWLVLGAADPHHTAASVLEQIRTPAGALYRRQPSPDRPDEPAPPRRTPRPPRHHSRPPRRGAPPDIVPTADLEAELPQTIEGCAAALEHRPLDADLHVLHARLLLEAGRAVSAVQAAKRALFLAPGLASAHLVLGSAHLAVQDAPRAASAFERAGHLLASLPRGADGLETARLLEIARSGARRSAERSSR